MVNTLQRYETNNLEEMGVRLKLTKIENKNNEQNIFKDRISSYEYNKYDFDTTLKRLDIFDIPKDNNPSMNCFSMPISHLLCVLPFFLISMYFYRCYMNMNAYLQEVRISQLKLLIQTVRLHQHAKDSDRLIDFYRKALIKWKERAEESEGLIRRYNNATCKNDSFETSLLRMEELQIKLMLKEFNID